jgi:hypothetical protein
MRTMFFWKKFPLRSVFAASALVLGGLSASAATYTNDFNVDPATDPNPLGPVVVRPSAVWRSTGSFDGSGFVSITDALGSLQGAIVLPDLDPAATQVVGFRFYAKVRIGGGTARPADGMSFSFADPTDAVVGGGTVGEEGTTTGLTVSFDTWDNRDGGSALAGDGTAIDIKVNNVIIAHKLFQGDGSRGPYCSVVETDAAGNPISIETDPTGTAAPGTWVDLEIILSPGGTLSLNYKGHQIFRDIVTGFAPRLGRFVIGARTGGATDNHWIDNIGITTDVSDPPPRTVTTTPNAPGRRDVGELTPVSFVIDASFGFTQVDPASINLTLNGTDVTSSAVIDNSVPSQTSVTYTPTGLGYAPGSRQEAVLTYREATDAMRTITVRNTFFVTPVPAATATGTSLFVEAEDFNYTDGTTPGQFFDFPTANAAYNGLAAAHTIDYNLGASNPDSPLYRVLNPMNGISNPGAPGDNLRAGTAITTDYKVGWNDNGDWYNFTRTFPNTTYKVYGRFSSGGANTAAQLDRVTSDRTVSPQTTTPLGSFNQLTTGGWDIFCFIPLRDAGGNDVIVRLNGLTTLRLSVLPGNYDANYLAFVPTFSPSLPPAIVTTAPLNNSESIRDPLIRAVITDRDTAVVPGSIRMFLGTNELTPLVITDTAQGAEAQFQVTNLLAQGTVQTVSVVFTDNDAVPVTQTNTWSFTVGPFKGGGKTLFVEAEDFNYSIDGVAGGLHANFGDPDCSLLGSNAVRQVDYAQGNGNDAGAVPAYRAPTDVEAAKPGTDGFVRGDRTITCSYIVGWNDPGDWQNYTRVFTNNVRYNVYARLSSGGAAEDVEFARITSDPTLPDQTKDVIGGFRSPATGNWDVFHTVPLRNAANELVSIRLTGTNTFRVSHLPGNFDINYFAFVVADVEFVPARIQSFEPPIDSTYARQPRIVARFLDEDSQVVASSLRLFYDGTEVTSTSTITDTASGAEISYQVPTASPTGTVHTVEVRWTDNQTPTPLTQTFSWSYREGIYNADSNLFIEMEDFNTASGDFLPSKPGVPFNQKGLYNGLGATTGTDFNDTGNPEPESNLYRTIETPNVGMAVLNDANRTGAGPRPGFETIQDYKVGWTTPSADWYNYTRDFGAGGTYNVYLRASHGDTAAGITIGGRLDHLDDPVTPTPVITPLGNFRAPTTGNWDGFTYVPLKDTTSGNVVALPLTGLQTLRYTVEANGGDVNYLMFVPTVPVNGPLTISRSGNNVTITWPNGNLQSAPAITGPWTTETGAVSPLQLNNTTGMKFYRTITP